MKKHLSVGGGFFLALAILPASHSQTFFVDEGFDSYADTAAMQQNWGSSGLGTLDTALGNPGQSARHNGGTVNSWIGSTFSLTPTATQNIRLTADIYDEGTKNDRLTVGLRNGPNPLFEMGHYNSTTEHYHVRVLNFAGNEGWMPLEPGLAGSTPPVGWNRYEAVFSLTGVTVTLDLGADGTIDGSITSEGAPSANEFTDLRFGGPSNFSSAGGGANFDNISLALVAVPEPHEYALVAGLALIGFAAFRRFKVRSA